MSCSSRVLEPRGPLHGLFALAELLAEPEADRPGDAEDDETPDEVADTRVGTVVGDDRIDADLDRQPRERLPPLPDHAEQEGRSDGGQEEHPVVVGQPRVDEAGPCEQRDSGDGGAERKASAREQRDDAPRCREHVEPQRALRRVLLAVSLVGDRNRDGDTDRRHDHDVEPVPLGQGPDPVPDPVAHVVGRRACSR